LSAEKIQAFLKKKRKQRKKESRKRKLRQRAVAPTIAGYAKGEAHRRQMAEWTPFSSGETQRKGWLFPYWQTRRGIVIQSDEHRILTKPYIRDRCGR
jgi:hypothetical protein